MKLLLHRNPWAVFLLAQTHKGSLFLLDCVSGSKNETLYDGIIEKKDFQILAPPYHYIFTVTNISYKLNKVA